MSKRHFLALCALALLVVAAPARADDAASSTPPLSIQETASSTPPAPTPPPSPDPVDITLTIETPDATLFAGPLTVSACAPSAGSADEVVGYCALEQSGVGAAWSWWGDDAFLDSLGGVPNDNAGGVYWMWFANLEMGGAALNRHILTEGESLLVTLGKMPLKLHIEPAQPVANSTTTITVFAFGFDESYNPVWLPAAQSLVHAGTRAILTDAAGTASFVATGTEPFEAHATKDSFVASPRLIIAPAQAQSTPAQETPASVSGGSKSPKPPTGAVQALSFLLAQQRSDGSFGSVMVSDWAALALAAAGAPRDAKAALGDFLVSAKKPASLTDYERRAMALLALGINPHEANTIQKIAAGFDGTQMGDPGMLNDDIFAIFPLLHAGYKASDDMIIKIASHIVSNQEQDGSWRYQDITSAAVQALTPLSGLDGVPAALVRATTYLKNLQQEDGCMGNVYSHSWAMQALGSRNDAASMGCLLNLQQEDGGFEPAQADPQNRTWATSYALSALSGKPWNEVLKNFPKPKEKEGASRGPDSGTPEGGLVLGAATTTEPLAATTTNALLPYIAPTVSPIETPAAPPAQTIVPKKSAPDAPATVREELPRDQVIAPTVPQKPIVEFLLSLWQRLASLLWFI